SKRLFGLMQPVRKLAGRLADNLDSHWRLVRCLFAYDLQQFDLENQGCAAGDGRGMTLIAVGEIGWADQAGFAADFHQLNAFGPAGDDAVEREGRGFVALVRTIELGAVDQGAAIVDLDRIGRGGRRAGAWGQFFVNEAGCGLDCAGFLGCFGEVSRGGVFFTLRHDCGAGHYEALNARTPDIELNGWLADAGVRQGTLNDVELRR